MIYRLCAFLALQASLLLAEQGGVWEVGPPDRCTAIGVGRKAMIDGSTVTTHNNDCAECDIRVTHVPARDWPEGSKRPIFLERAAYPRYLEKREDNIHGPDYLVGTEDSSIYPWQPMDPIFYIDQVPHTYGYTMGTYGIQNEKQVSMGESTCAAVFYGVPPTSGGNSHFNMHALTEVALERCDTARCAAQTMGDLAVQFGFYGPEWDISPEAAKMEGGEAIVISDPDETWMWHILSDDTGSSAVWVAQRVPDDHITAIANQFTIGEIDLDNKDYFMGSSNLYKVAQRAGLWSPDSGKPFNFAQIYGYDLKSMSQACTRRVWRVLTMAAPSLLPQFSPYTDSFATFGFGPDGSQPYPFSVKPDKPLTVVDIMNMNRDNYEGTPFDMTTGPDAGPFGDPTRYSPIGARADPVNGITWEEMQSGTDFGRSISLWRTAYSTVTQARRSLPDDIGAVTWIAQYAPHHSSFVPVYAAANHTPSSLNTGTLFKYERKANWWVHCLVSNYLSRWYKYTNPDIRALQAKVEQDLLDEMYDVEERARKVLENGSTKKTTPEDVRQRAIAVLSDFQERTAGSVRDQWYEFFWNMVAKYRDIVRVVDPHVDNYAKATANLGVPRWWLEQIGYWGSLGAPPTDKTEPVPIHRYNIPTFQSREAYEEAYPEGMEAPFPSRVLPAAAASPAPTAAPNTIGSYNTSDVFVGFMCFLSGLGLGLVAATLFYRSQNQGYLPIN